MPEQKTNLDTSIKKDFESEFIRERNEWTERIKLLAVRLRNIKEVAGVQVDLFSYRQILLEYNSSLLQVMTKLNSKLRKDRGDRLKYYSENHQVKYGANEKTPLIDADLSELKERIEIVDTQIGFLNETIKTVDFMLYGVKDRIRVQEFLIGGTAK
jgi:hypothetical protein